MSDFVMSFEKDRVMIFDTHGTVVLACSIKGEWSAERERKIVDLAAQLYAECYNVEIVAFDGPFANEKPS